MAGRAAAFYDRRLAKHKPAGVFTRTTTIPAADSPVPARLHVGDGVDLPGLVPGLHSYLQPVVFPSTRRAWASQAQCLLMSYRCQPVRDVLWNVSAARQAGKGALAGRFLRLNLIGTLVALAGAWCSEIADGARLAFAE